MLTRASVLDIYAVDHTLRGLTKIQCFFVLPVNRGKSDMHYMTGVPLVREREVTPWCVILSSNSFSNQQANFLINRYILLHK